MQRFKNILCVISTDATDNGVLDHAVKLALNNQASLTVVEVIDEIPPNTHFFEGTQSPIHIQSLIVAEHQKKLDEMILPLSEKINIKSKVLTGILFLEVIYEVLRNGHDLVLKMAESGGLLDRVFGSDDMHLLRKNPCPVWLVKPQSPKTYQRIVAAVDIDDKYSSEELSTRKSLNIQTIQLATSLAIAESAKLHIVHIWDAIGEGAMRHGFIHTPEHKINTYVEEIKQRQNHNMKILIDEIKNTVGQDVMEYIKPEIHLLKGDPRKNVPRFTAEIKADTIVMGTVARTGLPGFFMGNTAENILNQLDCSVLAVKPHKFVTPVVLH